MGNKNDWSCPVMELGKLSEAGHAGHLMLLDGSPSLGGGGENNKSKHKGFTQYLSTLPRWKCILSDHNELPDQSFRNGHDGSGVN